MKYKYNGRNFIQDIGKPPSRRRYHIGRDRTLNVDPLDYNYMDGKNGFTPIQDDSTDVHIYLQDVQNDSKVVQTTSKSTKSNSTDSQENNTDSNDIHKDSYIAVERLGAVDGDLNKLTKAELLGLVTLAGLETSGTKADLISRLQ